MANENQGFSFSLEQFKALSPEERLEAMRRHRERTCQSEDARHRCIHCGDYFDECRCDGGL